jgi:hypothetical protein
VPWLWGEVVADRVELLQVSDKSCGGTRSVIYIERSEASCSAHHNLSVVNIQKPGRSHHEAVSHLSTGLRTGLLSCNSACLWSKSPLIRYLSDTD